MSEQKKTLIVLADEYRSIADIAAQAVDQAEDGDAAAAIAAALAEKAMPLEQKACAVVYVMRQYDDLADAIGARIKELQARKKAIESKAKALADYVLYGMATAGIQKIESPDAAISRRKNPPRVEVYDEGMIQAEFWRQPEPPPPVLDRRALLEALKDGEIIQGCRLVQDERLHIA